MKRTASLLLVFLSGSSALSAQEARPLEIEDMFSIQSVGSPRVSPDGEWVAYTVSSTGLDEADRSTRLWMVPFEGGDALPMTLEGESVGSPGWSPDGRWLSFLASRDGEETQVWGLDRRGGEAQQLTDVEQGVSGYEWSPDGTRLLLSIRDPKGAPGDTTGGEAGDGGEDTPEPYIIDRLQFKRDYVGYLDRRRTHLYVFDLDTDRLFQITDGDYDDSGAVWSPDGTRVVFVSNRTEEPDANDNSDLWAVDVPDSLAGSVPAPKQLTTNPGSDGSPAFSPDGRWIAYVRTTEPEIIWYDVNELAVIPADGGQPRVLTGGLDRNVSSPAFGPGGRIWFILEDSGERQLARIGPDGSGLERIVDGDRVASSPHLGPTGAVVMLLSAVHQPREVFALEGRTPRRLTHVNDEALSGFQLGQVRNIHFQSEDGNQVEGWLTLPPGYQSGTRYPAILEIHGGPVAQFDWSFDFNSQLMAANGYVVIRANPRGSSGYGQTFSYAIWADWGNKDFQDVMAAVDYAIAEGYADPDRLGVVGWSYGGILTNYVITQTDRFEGAITGASEVLYRSNYGHDHYQRHWEAELGLPWGETAENWERISPFNSVENIVTPTLIMGGAIDWNVPILNSEQLFQALKRLHRETLLVVYPGEHHGIRSPEFQKDRLERWLDWFDLYVKGGFEPGEARADWDGALERLQG